MKDKKKIMCTTYFDKQNKEYSDLIALWILRGLIHLGGHKKFIENRGFYDSDVLRAIGLDALNKIDKIKPNHSMGILKRRLNAVENKQNILPNDNLYKNLRWLSGALSLSSAEESILYFLVVLNNDRDLRDGIRMISAQNQVHLVIFFSTILNISRESVLSATSKDSPLFSSGVIKLYDSTDINDIKILNGLALTLNKTHDKKENILDSFFYPSPKSKLTQNNFRYIQNEFEFISAYLKSTIDRKTPGVNILIYGEPGTGKTEFARMTTEETGLKPYEITMNGKCGESISGHKRFNMYKFGQSLISKQQKAIILFDEIEDVFPDARNNFSYFANKIIASSGKAWVNKLLENNPVPAFWISNNINQIDRAYLRRFDYILEMKSPPRSVRKSIYSSYLNNMELSENWMDKISQNRHLTPAHVERAAKIIDHINPTKDKIESTLDAIIGNSMYALGDLTFRKSISKGNDNLYQLNLINSKPSVEPIIKGLEKSESGRICLYGPPGTGKTAFGYHLSKVLDIPLIIKRAPDILSMYVGEAEKNIARMFREAENEKAILLLDEADSFIQDRQGAQHSWEITQVNEFLVQMESFSGIFIASTNFLEILDSASLRRFDVKIKFNYLNYDQRILFFNNIIKENNWAMDIENEEIAERFSNMDNLSSGDFATVSKKLNLYSKTCASSLLQALEDEIALKPDSRRNSIGFSASLN